MKKKEIFGSSGGPSKKTLRQTKRNLKRGFVPLEEAKRIIDKELKKK